MNSASRARSSVTIPVYRMSDCYCCRCCCFCGGRFLLGFLFLSSREFIPGGFTARLFHRRSLSDGSPPSARRGMRALRKYRLISALILTLCFTFGLLASRVECAASPVFARKFLKICPETAWIPDKNTEICSKIDYPTALCSRIDAKYATSLRSSGYSLLLIDCSLLLSDVAHLALIRL